MDAFWSVFLPAIALFVMFDVAANGAYVLGLIFKPIVEFFAKYVLGIDRVQAGPEAMLGSNARALTDFREDDEGRYVGKVRIAGEEWTASAEEVVSSGETVRVLEVRGLTLAVDRVSAASSGKE